MHQVILLMELYFWESAFNYFEVQVTTFEKEEYQEEDLPCQMLKLTIYSICSDFKTEIEKYIF